MSCDIFGKMEKVFGGLGDCIEALAENRKTDALKSVFGVGKSLTELTIETTSCVIENTPKAISTIQEVKKEVISTIEDEVNNYQKEKKEQLLEEKIKQLKVKK